MCHLDVLTCLLALVGGPDDRRDLRETQGRQERVRVETEDVDARLAAMVRVLKFQGLGTSGEAKRLDEVAAILEKLDEGPMAEIVERLGRAAEADAQKAGPEVDQARLRHREVLEALRALLARRRAQRTLDEAAERLERAAERQEALRQKTEHLARDEHEAATVEDPRRRDRLNAAAPARRQQALAAAQAQDDLKRDVAATLQRLGELRDRLPSEDRERLQKAEDAARSVAEAIDRPAPALRADGDPRARAEHLADAAELQREARDALRTLARAIRPPADPAEALRQARDRVAQALHDQQAAREAAADRARDDALADPGLARLADRQGRIGDEAQELSDMLEPLDPTAARALGRAGDEAREAHEALQDGDPEHAMGPQDRALEALRQAEAGLDRALAAMPRPSDDGTTADEARRVRKALAAAKAAREASAKAAEEGGREALAHSEAANDEARAALDQAEAAARPGEGLADRLDAAARDLDRAAERLKHGSPSPARDAQGEAVAHLEEALHAIEGAQVAANAQPGARPGKPGRSPSATPGQTPGKATSKAPANSLARGTGNRAPADSGENDPSSLMAVEGPGAFLGLPPRQREAVRQALRDALPPEYAPLIRQYYINIARGRPAAAAKAKGDGGKK